MSSSQLNITTSLATFNTNGLTWATAVISNGPATLTSNFQCTTLRVAASVTWAGAYDITCANLVESNAGGITLTIPTGRTLDVSNSIAFGTGITSTASLITSSNTSAAYINYTGTPASCLLYNTNFTHITASGNPLYDFGSATLSSTSGISNINLGALIKNGMFIQ